MSWKYAIMADMKLTTMLVWVIGAKIPFGVPVLEKRCINVGGDNSLKYPSFQMTGFILLMDSS